MTNITALPHVDRGHEPVPVGTLVTFVFRVAGYSNDVDGTRLAHVEQVDRSGDETGWETSLIGLYPEANTVVASADALHLLTERHEP